MSADLYSDALGHEWLNDPSDRPGTDRCLQCRQTMNEISTSFDTANCPGPGPRVIEPAHPWIRPLTTRPEDLVRAREGLAPFGAPIPFEVPVSSFEVPPLPRRVSLRSMQENLANAVRNSRINKLLAKRLDDQPFPAFPAPAYLHDCGLDLALAEDVVIDVGGTVNAATGVAVALPPNTFGWITGRSSTWAKHGLIVMPGIIDETWRGELRVLMYRPRRDTPRTFDSNNGTPARLHLPAGTRVAQLIVLPNLLEQVEVVTLPKELNLPEGERGVRGFGSSGS
jgi:dUTPase